MLCQNHSFIMLAQIGMNKLFPNCSYISGNLYILEFHLTNPQKPHQLTPLVKEDNSKNSFIILKREQFCILVCPLHYGAYLLPKDSKRRRRGGSSRTRFNNIHFVFQLTLARSFRTADPGKVIG